MFLFGDRLFFDADRRPGDVAAACFIPFCWATLGAWVCSAVQCLWLGHDNVECIVGSTSLLDVEGVMLKIQTGSEKNKIFPRLVEEHTYVCWKHVMKYKTLLLRNKTFCSKLVGVSAQDVGNMTGMLPRDWIALNIVMAQPEALHCRTLTRQGSLSKREWSRCRSDIPRRRSGVEEKSLTKEKHVSQQALMSNLYLRKQTDWWLKGKSQKPVPPANNDSWQGLYTVVLWTLSHHKNGQLY